MNEITFEDVISHYRIKIMELSDDMETLRQKLDAAHSIIDVSWKGLSADTCDEKVEYSKNEIAKANNELSVALSMLAGIELPTIE